MSLRILGIMFLAVSIILTGGCLNGDDPPNPTETITPPTSETLTDTVETPEVADPPVAEEPPVVPGMNLIEPGKGAGGIKLGDPFEKVKQLYGEPDRVALDTWFYAGEFSFSGADKNVVDSIRIGLLNKKAKTAGGVGIDSTRQQVENEFGKPDPLDPDIPIPGWWDYRKKGITFKHRDDKVREIVIKKPW